MAKPFEVKDETFATDIEASKGLVLVDFWAAWCGPCRMLAPTVEQVAEKYQGKAKIVKLNVDENVESPAKYGIRGIPTLILFNKGQEVDRHVGVPQNALTAVEKANAAAPQPLAQKSVGTKFSTLCPQIMM
jgi:thioredoxin 1